MPVVKQLIPRLQAQELPRQRQMMLVLALVLALELALVLELELELAMVLALVLANSLLCSVQTARPCWISLG